MNGMPIGDFLHMDSPTSEPHASFRRSDNWCPHQRGHMEPGEKEAETGEWYQQPTFLRLPSRVYVEEEVWGRLYICKLYNHIANVYKVF